MNDELPRYAVSINFKKNLGNYESMDIYVGVSNVSAENVELVEEEGAVLVERIYAHLKGRLQEAVADASRTVRG